MQRRIIGFRQDDAAHWVVELACGHSQHVRHEPPWFVREWTLTAEGRAKALGTMFDCGWCERDAQGATPPPPVPDA